MSICWEQTVAYYPSGTGTEHNLKFSFIVLSCVDKGIKENPFKLSNNRKQWSRKDTLPLVVNDQLQGKLWKVKDKSSIVYCRLSLCVWPFLSFHVLPLFPFSSYRSFSCYNRSFWRNPHLPFQEFCKPQLCSNML